MEERRHFIRLPAHLVTHYTVIGSGPPQASLTRNTSGGGIGFFTESQLAPGTVLEVTVAFPNRQQPLAFTAEVVWSGKLLLARDGEEPRAYETGVRFIEIAPEDQAFIMQYSTSGAPPRK